MRFASVFLASLVLVGCSDNDGATQTGGSTSTATGAGTSNGSGSGSSATGNTSSSGSGSGGGTFMLEVHTELDATPGLILRVNLPIDSADCLALGGGRPCDDLDVDGITDAWEDAALDRLRPIQRFDEAETLIDDPAIVLGDVGRVFSAGDLVHLYMMLGYSIDYGSCGGISGHNGDSERIALELVRLDDGRTGDVRVQRAYTAAHEGTASDHGHVFTGAEIADLTHDLDGRTGEPRWVVFPSADKHGTYGTVDLCEAASQIPCFDEDCGPDGVADPALYDRLPPYLNAGEEATPLVTDLTAIGFPGDDAWAVQDFCGGLGNGSSCSDDVRNKLLNDPFP